MKKIIRAKMTFAALVVALFLLALVPVKDRTEAHPSDKKQKKGNVVYVCACLNTRSCSCMTEAKTEGPCSCGTEGGPPMKAVPTNSDWAKQNRDALAH